MKKLITLLASALMIFAGCADSSSPNDESVNSQSVTVTEKVSETSSIQPDFSGTDTSPGSKEIDCSLYPDKPHLKLMLPINRTFSSELLERTSELLESTNEMLDKKGCSFAIDLVIINELKIHPLSYYAECLEKGRNVDIVVTGVGVSAEVASSKDYEPHDNTYHECVEKGWLEPLDGYLDTDEGRRLCESLGTARLEPLMADGHIYGISTSEMLCPALLFNKQTAEKYGFDISAFDGKLSSLEPVLERMKSDGIAGLGICDYGFDLMYEEYLDFSLDRSGVFINERTGKAENIFENEDFIKLAELMHRYNTLGYIVNAEGIEPSDAKYLCRLDTLSSRAEDEAVQVVIGNSYYANDYKNMTWGISSASKHKDEAFELLRMFCTDSELALLFSCGEEGVDHTVQDGRIVIHYNANVPYRGLSFYASPADPAILPPIAYEWEKNVPERTSGERKDKPEIHSLNLSSAKRSAMYNVALPDDLIERLKPIAKIYADNYKLFYGTMPDSVDTVLKSANEQLKEAGIDELLAEVNKYITEKEK